jgi:hypothetical protein
MVSSEPPAYWLYTRAKDDAMTLHLDNCPARNGRYRKSPRWTGPLTSEQIAVMPQVSYFVCTCIARAKVRAREYGPRRLLSPQHRRS